MKESKSLGMGINFKKTKVIVAVRVDERVVTETIEQFVPVYLGSMVRAD